MGKDEGRLTIDDRVSLLVGSSPILLLQLEILSDFVEEVVEELVSVLHPINVTMTAPTRLVSSKLVSSPFPRFGSSPPDSTRPICGSHKDPPAASSP
jgi:hypothetical protein